MASATTAGEQKNFSPRPVHFAALLAGNAALALGPWFVRVADSGAVAAGFWRLALAVPFLALLARGTGEQLTGIRRPALIAVLVAGVVFALDLASWHVGIEMTRMGNATLFGNSGSLVLMVWGFVIGRRLPHRGEWWALGAALTGAGILLGRSLEISATTLAGDLFCLLAGMFYAGYLLILADARKALGSWAVLSYASLAGTPVILALALMRGEPVWPQDWTPIIGLMISSQLVGQGLLVYSLRHFPPLVIGLALLTQPAVAAVVGWLAFGETLGTADIAGMALVGLALVLARTRQPGPSTIANAAAGRP